MESITKVMVVLFCTLLQSQLTVGYDQVVVNKVGDYILKTLKAYYPSSLHISKKIQNYGNENYMIETEKGVISNFSTISRAGDIMLSFDGDDALVNFQFTFGDLNVRYEEYRVKIFGILASTGSVTASILDNLIEIEVKMSKHSSCFLTITKINVLTFKNIKLRFFGLDNTEESYWKGLVTTQISKNFEEMFREKVETMIRMKLPKIMKPNNYICRNNAL